MILHTAPESAATRGLTILSVIVSSSLFCIQAGTVRVPAGSSDALAAAVTAAGPGGTVILKAGLHKESGPVTVLHRISILGEPGAVLETATTADPDYPITIAGAIHLKQASHVKVRGVTFRPVEGTTGSCAIVIEDSPHAEVLENRVTDYQFGILVQHGNHARIHGNTIRVSSAWGLDPSDPDYLIDTEGIVIINGRFVQVTDNRVAGGFDGIWLCDGLGLASGNTVTECYIGLVLCRVPELAFSISGKDAFAEQPGNHWLVHNNEAYENEWGLQVTDGCHDNLLLNNEAAGNNVYDCELTGDTNRYGYFVPGCFNNAVLQGGRNHLLVKDCGAGNRVRGNVTVIDTTADPCY